MPGVRVGVLADDQHPDVGERSLERPEDPVAGRLVARRRRARAQELTHLGDPVVDRRERLGPVAGDQALVDEPGESAQPPRNGRLRQERASTPSRRPRRPGSPGGSRRPGSRTGWRPGPGCPGRSRCTGCRTGSGSRCRRSTGASGKRATSAPVLGSSSTIWLVSPAMRDVDVAGPPADAEAVGQVGGLRGPQRLDRARATAALDRQPVEEALGRRDPATVARSSAG